MRKSTSTGHPMNLTTATHAPNGVADLHEVLHWPPYEFDHCNPDPRYLFMRKVDLLSSDD